MEELNIEEGLLKEGLISKKQYDTLKIEEERSSISPVDALRRLKLIPEDILIDFLSKKLHLEKFDLSNFSPSGGLASLLPWDFVLKNKIIPLFTTENNELAVGILDPLNHSILEELRFRTSLFIKPYLVKEEELNNVLNIYCEKSKETQYRVLEEKIREEGTKPSIVEAVDLLLLQATRANASDIHIEPQKEKMVLRLRIDGVLKEITPVDPHLYNAFISRIKIMSNLDIAQRRIPQDGRFTFNSDEGDTLDIRVSVIPTIQGESIVLRLLRQNKKLLTLSESGMSEDNLKIYKRLIQHSSGIVLVTGPTGSGKTTTLYASLLTLKSSEKNIITIEDPVEYKLDFCRQIQVNPNVALTFATGLRSILRHDPDIVMIGEIRDLETATIAIQAALTGHLVFSTLHTNNAPSAITRLIDMGIEPFLIASCLNGAVAQRLVRVLCPKCKRRVTSNDVLPQAVDRIKGDSNSKNIYEAVGCQDCLYTGFSGRVGVFEIMEMTPQIGHLAIEKSSSEEIANLSKEAGMKFLYDDGWKKVLDGLTSPQELLRVLGV